MRSCLYFMIQTNQRTNVSPLLFLWAAHLAWFLRAHLPPHSEPWSEERNLHMVSGQQMEIETERERAMNIRWFHQMPSVWSLKFCPPLRRFVPTVCSSLSLWPSHLSAVLQPHTQTEGSSAQWKIYQYVTINPLKYSFMKHKSWRHLYKPCAQIVELSKFQWISNYC